MGTNIVQNYKHRKGQNYNCGNTKLLLPRLPSLLIFTTRLQKKTHYYKNKYNNLIYPQQHSAYLVSFSILMPHTCWTLLPATSEGTKREKSVITMKGNWIRNRRTWGIAKKINNYSIDILWSCRLLRYIIRFFHTTILMLTKGTNSDRISDLS